MSSGYRANATRKTDTLLIGREHSPVVVIDDFLADMSDLVDFAANEARFGAPNNWYPGLRATPLPQPYVIAAIQALHVLVSEAFELPADGQVDANAYFGLATLAPEALSPIQRVPHFDTANPRQIALLHYLCEAKHGGTSFYRHRATGYENISEDRQRAYYDCLQKELTTKGPRPPRYVSGDDDLFEEIARFEARPNRMLIYRSRALHSGNVNVEAGLSSDPRAGRLTANIFLAYR
jgi:hypothetical protein